MRVFAVVNQKGGCGKTTTAINLSGVLASRGYRTLLVDMDPQGHCAAGLAIPEQRIDLQIGDALLAGPDDSIDTKRLLWRVSRKLDLAPATLRLAALEASRGDLAALPDAEHRLRSVLSRLASQYDICIIDCSPAVGMLAFNAMVAASDVLIPVETGFFSLQGATKQINAIKSLGKRLGVAPVHHLLATMHDPTSALSQDLLDELRRRFGARVLPTVIRYDHALREAASFGQPVIEYAPDSTGAGDYAALADHLMNTPSKGEITPSADSPRIVINDAPAHSSAASYIAAATTAHQPVASQSAPGAEVADAPVSRQLDMVMRARKLHNATAPLPTPDAGIAHVTFSEVKPVTDLFSPPASVIAKPAASSPPPPKTIEHGAFGMSHTDNALVFRQPAGIGQVVAVAGDFNAWNPAQGTLERNPASGVLEKTIVCPPGTYQYRLVVDGQWMPDPFNPVISSNPFGGSNSVAVMPGRASTPVLATSSSRSLA